MEQIHENNTIDLAQLLKLLRRHIGSLLIWSLGFAIIAWGVSSFMIQPKYSASTQLLVNQKTDEKNIGAAYTLQQANMQVITTYKDIVTSPKILKAASKQLANPVKVVKEAVPAKYETLADGTKKLVKKAQPAVLERSGKSYTISATELSKAISVSTQQQSQVFSIKATSDTPEKAQAEANAVAQTFKTEIPEIMSVNNVTVIADANNGTQTFPNVRLFTIAGFVLGFVICLFVIILKEMLNTTVRDDEFMTKTLGLTNLGQIDHYHLSNSFKISKVTKTPSSSRIRSRRV
ncbi:YveK family protein [Lactobacillus mulieris]|uniref:Capsular polysaccharide biosynthesis protein CpsC n=1 Tax=Lactobacillus mulieris TaxID=2508708 RepID=A0AAW5WYH1_9LACO|nr:Wzz/FepE/Etk N-terminal domain-containing protein [Lactobacillus mulieris]MCZ3622337.1 Wzz/FepE/Etk N-terminal domain-containing protein [Lactobacillus mulieris]MCZ3622963.1 Wzz/FepE/Etk N-terminal domain-containing protein [Lactobacillus mulieris]MCZ3636344.1 Wzz/FepE/Etk N-terminal domain-containing protein [Lactobacillus mulieris]MCZ3690712.1 Wzz/FepE/Etk N-terminal domain-containing protein [Lactobacillus mulieris]MCZ3696670.1 Wzz/FepE/Etk N-terminal domain-containing protein [Lactobaci